MSQDSFGMESYKLSTKDVGAKLKGVFIFLLEISFMILYILQLEIQNPKICTKKNIIIFIFKH